ncbi:AAA family ATPase [Candidatus Micrarchaeota archaeon]|nr:AAA family ATPase [Candidatus Micrarchaeota archaeon]MBU1931036.1 AAA family ATPase [Candidatus Micrarchaeota archaeon]
MKTNVIIISGIAGSGKSTLAESISKELGWKCVHASDILRQLKHKKMEEIDPYKTKQGKGYWESEEAMQYCRDRLQNLDWDKLVNERLYKLVEEGNVVFDSWTLPWLTKKGVKIWLKVSSEERIKRLADRDTLSIEKAQKRVLEKEEKTIAIFEKAFGFRFGADLSPFHLILDTNSLNAKEVFKIVSCFSKVWLEKKQ